MTTITLHSSTRWNGTLPLPCAINGYVIWFGVEQPVAAPTSYADLLESLGYSISRA